MGAYPGVGTCPRRYSSIISHPPLSLSLPFPLSSALSLFLSLSFPLLPSLILCLSCMHTHPDTYQEKGDYYLNVTHWTSGSPLSHRAQHNNI